MKSCSIPNKILVLILETETKPSDKQIHTLLELFSDPFFEVHQCKFPTQHSFLKGKKIHEDYMLRKALHYASYGPYTKDEPLLYKRKWKDIPVLVIKDSSICMLTNDDFIKKIKEGFYYGNEADLLYLCKWNDLCELYKDVSITKSKPFLQWSLRPNGTQAILFQPHTRDVLYKEWKEERFIGSIQERIQKKIKKGEWKALVYSPNLISYDIQYATSKLDYMKRNECADLKEMMNPYYVASNENTDTTMNIIYTILFIIFIFFVAFVCITYHS